MENVPIITPTESASAKPSPTKRKIKPAGLANIILPASVKRMKPA